MQIKFSHKEDGVEKWEVFGDIDHYTFYQEHPVLGGTDIEQEECMDFTEDGNPNKRWVIEFFTKNTHGEASILVANSPIFISNEDGRTIDKI